MRVCNIPEEAILHRMRVFENRMLRRVFGQMSDNVTGGWRKLHNKLHLGIIHQPSKQ
jgi:hypothetical protein